MMDEKGKRKLGDEELEQVAGGGEGDDPKGGHKYTCTTCGGEFCFDFIVDNPICPSCGNSTLQKADRKKELGPWRPRPLDL